MENRGICQLLGTGNLMVTGADKYQGVKPMSLPPPPSVDKVFIPLVFLLLNMLCNATASDNDD